MIRTIQNGRGLCTAEKLVLNDRINRDDLIMMGQVSISPATRRKASDEAGRLNVQARSKPARELTRSDKRVLTALDTNQSCRSPHSAKRWGRGFFVCVTKDLAKKP